MMVPAQTRWNTWFQSRPKDRSYLSFTTWWTEWKTAMLPCNVPLELAVDQFTVCLRDFFPEQLKAMLMYEQDHGAMSLNARYSFMLNRVKADERMSLLPDFSAPQVPPQVAPSAPSNATPASTTLPANGTTSKTVESETVLPLPSAQSPTPPMSMGPCYNCGAPGHWYRQCPHPPSWDYNRQRRYSNGSQGSRGRTPPRDSRYESDGGQWYHGPMRTSRRSQTQDSQTSIVYGRYSSQLNERRPSSSDQRAPKAFRNVSPIRSYSPGKGKVKGKGKGK